MDISKIFKTLEPCKPKDTNQNSIGAEWITYTRFPCFFDQSPKKPLEISKASINKHYLQASHLKSIHTCDSSQKHCAVALMQKNFILLYNTLWHRCATRRLVSTCHIFQIVLTCPCANGRLPKGYRTIFKHSSVLTSCAVF